LKASSRKNGWCWCRSMKLTPRGRRRRSDNPSPPPARGRAGCRGCRAALLGSIVAERSGSRRTRRSRDRRVVPRLGAEVHLPVNPVTRPAPRTIANVTSDASPASAA
jgi:hypothetical protein